jgi:hypothetical protein
MKPSSTQREILLITNNSFAQQQWCRNEFKGDDNNITPQEQMEEICANGLIYDILPELFGTDENKKLYLWQMHPGFSFLQLEYGEFPLAIEKARSLDPHNSLMSRCYN